MSLQFTDNETFNNSQFSISSQIDNPCPIRLYINLFRQTSNYNNIPIIV